MKLTGKIVAGVILAGVTAMPAQAQLRAQEVRAPAVDPVLQRLNTIQVELEALKQSAGRQVLVLHFTPTELGGWLDNNFNTNQQRSENLCKQALDDRYGRVLSRRVQSNGDYYFFSHVVCETKP